MSRSTTSDPRSAPSSRHVDLGRDPHLDDERATTIGEFLDGRAARHVCLSCIAAAVRIPLHDATAMVARVGASRGYRIMVGATCRTCGTDGVTVTRLSSP